jgi:DNA repair exonuclease SbcCD ATPase subunit
MAVAFMNANQKKIEQDEKELEELLKEQGEQKPDDDDTQEQSSEERKPEADPDNEEEKTFKKRYGDLRRYSQQKDKEYKEKIEELEAKLEKINEQIGDPEEEIPTTLRELQAWRNKNPEASRILETLIKEEANKLFESSKTKIDTFEAAQKKAEKEKGLELIRAKHSDFDDLESSDEFHDWVDEQPKWVQDALYVNGDDPRSVIRVIDLYKADMGLVEVSKKKEEREAKKAAASNVNTKGARAKVDADDAGDKIRESWVNKLSSVDYEKNEDKIMEAIRTGQFIYDMSGGAR